MKYILKQPHRNTCGVVAIVNILRSFGRKTSYAEILKEAGGLKKVSKRGMMVVSVMKILRKHNLDALPLSVSYKRMKEYAKHPAATVAVAYVWIAKVPSGPHKGKKIAGPHIVMMNKNGKAINTSKVSRVNFKRWPETKRVWGQQPITIVVVPRPGGVK